MRHEFAVRNSLGPYLSYRLFEKRFLRLKRLFETAKEPVPQRPVAVNLTGR
jgi:hypothetical protein